MILFEHKTRVLMVCTENICRSPMAEGLLKYHLRRFNLLARVKVSSVGTRTSQLGRKIDQRAQRVAAAAGISLGRMGARRVSERDLVCSDYIFVMDNANLLDLLKICPVEHQHKISLLLSHLPGHELDEVPDPYYGSVEGFGKVFQLIDAAVVELIPHIVD